MTDPDMPAARQSGDPPLPEGIQTPEAPQQRQWVWLARIRHPQGRKGEVFADILTDFPEKFAERRQLWLIAEQQAKSPTHTKVRGTGFSQHEDYATTPGTVKGTGFSPYINQPKTTGALAPEGNLPATAPAPREVTLSNHWLHKGGIVLHFSGVDSISSAEQLAGLIVAIPRAERAALADDETYIGDLVGCMLIDIASANEQPIGEIEGVDRTAGPVPLLIVRGSHGEILIPFAKEYLHKIDLEARRLEMALPEGLVDLNKPQ